jgi:plasmid replication initiation protein
MKIDNFKFESCGDLEVWTHKDGRKITHQYYCVPKKILLKLINAKSAPELSDVDKWVKEDQDAHDKVAATPCGYGFWGIEN